MVPENTNPQFQLEKAPDDFVKINVNKSGLSGQISSATEPSNTAGGDPNDRPVIPMNQFINTDQSKAQQMQTLQENYFQTLNQLTQKLHSVDRLSQGTSLQVLQKENEWKEKM